MNFKTAARMIDTDFCNTYYAKYMKDHWGIIVGFKTVEEYIVIMRKQLLDWQESSDCNNSLCTQSKGHISFTCCSSDSILMDFTVRHNCCLSGYILNPVDGLCYLPGSAVPLSPLPCSFCPTGYKTNTIGNVASCVGPTGDIVIVSQFGQSCVLPGNSTNVYGRSIGSPNKQCPDLVQNFNVISLPKISENFILNPPLNPHGKDNQCDKINIKEVIINTFTR